MKKHLTDRTKERRMDAINAVRNIAPELLVIEADLIDLKYPDYAFITAVEATRIFQREYIEIYQEYFGRYIDHEEKENKLGMKKLGLFDNPPKTITALWKARQIADALGIEYSLYCRLAFQHLTERGYSRLPLPNQIYSDHVVEAIEAKWADRGCETGMMFSHTTDPRFRYEHYCGEPAQNRYIQRQLDALNKKLDPHRPYLLATMCFERQTLHPDVIVKDFDLDISKVRKFWDGDVTELNAEVDVTDFCRPCFGLPHVVPTSLHLCEMCPLFEKCKLETNAVKENLLRRFGSVDLRGDHKRKMASERQRRKRARDKEIKLKEAATSLPEAT